MSTHGMAFMATVCSNEFCVSRLDVVDDTSVEPVDIRLDDDTDPPPEAENRCITLADSLSVRLEDRRLKLVWNLSDDIRNVSRIASFILGRSQLFDRYSGFEWPFDDGPPLGAFRDFRSGGTGGTDRLGSGGGSHGR
jgi:hypothetical protein